MTRVTLLPLLLAGALFAAPPRPVVVGLLLPPDEPQGESIRRGAALAIEESNGAARLAVRGRRGAWGSDASEAALLVEEDGAVALVAPPEGAGSHLVLQIAGKTATPVASLCADGSVTGAAVPWMVRVAPSTRDEAAFLMGASKAVSWLAFVPEGRAGREAASDLRRAARGRRIAVAAPPAGMALRALLSSIRPDGILLWVDAASAGTLAKTLREAGFAGTLAGPSRLDSSLFASAAAAAGEGVLVPRIAAPEGEFARRYRARHHADPDTAAALAHDAVILLVAHLRRERNQDSLPMIRAQGATGILEFDRSGNRIVRLELRRLSGARARG